MYKKTVSIAPQHSDQDYKYMVADTSRNRLYVLCDNLLFSQRSTVAVIDLSSNMIIDEIPLGFNGGVFMAIDSSNANLYILCSQVVDPSAEVVVTGKLFKFVIGTQTLTNIDISGITPQRLYLNESEDKLYIAGDDELQVLTLSTLADAASYKVNGFYYGETYIPPASTTTTTFAPPLGGFSHVFVTNSTPTGDINKIDASAKTKTVINVDAYPEDIARRNNGDLYIADRSSNDITVLDAVAGTTTTLTLPAGSSICSLDIDQDNGMLFAADSGNDKVYVINLANSTIINEFKSFDFPVKLIHDDVSNTIIVAHMETGIITFYDSSDLTHFDYDIGSRPYDMTFDEVGRCLYVSTDIDRIVKIDISDVKIHNYVRSTFEFEFFSPEKLLVDSSTNTLYVTAPNDLIYVLDLETTRMIKTIKVGESPSGLSLDQASKRLYVSNMRSNSISVISTESNTVIDTISDVGGVPVDIQVAIPVTTTTAAPSPPTVDVTLTIGSGQNLASSVNPNYLVFYGEVGDELQFATTSVSNSNESEDVLIFLNASAADPINRVTLAPEYISNETPFIITLASNSTAYTSDFGEGSVVTFNGSSFRRINLS